MAQNGETSSQKCDCPVCGKLFDPEDITDHVNKCLFLSEQSEPRETKRNFSIFSDKSPVSPSPRPKRSRISAAPSTSKVELVDLCKESPEAKFSPIPKSKSDSTSIPLAERVRPQTIEEYVGQHQILGEDSVLRRLFERNEIPSMILWGPPGCGKTTFSNIIHQKCKQSTNMRFVKTSAAAGSGVADIKEIVKVAQNELKFKRKTILFMDEIHRFNKLQQDVFLPHVESGAITLIGATTENPSFSLNSALLSRCRVIVLEKLQTDDLIRILDRGLREFDGFAVDSADDLEHLDIIPKIICERSTLKWLAEMSDGDARIALNSLQLAVQSMKPETGVQHLRVDELKEGIKKSHILYDRKGDQHFDMISALHKSIRAGDDNAALYWCTRMMVGGEDPRYIVRRLVRAASEDIGLADPQALPVALGALQAVQLVGMPEADCIIAQAAVYLARAPKSREVYNALGKCRRDITECKGSLPAVPLHLRNAPTTLMKNLGYGSGYNLEHKDVSGLTYMPEDMEDVHYFSE